MQFEFRDKWKPNCFLRKAYDLGRRITHSSWTLVLRLEKAGDLWEKVVADVFCSYLNQRKEAHPRHNNVSPNEKLYVRWGVLNSSKISVSLYINGTYKCIGDKS